VELNLTKMSFVSN